MKQKTQKKFFKIILLLFLVASIISASFVCCFAEDLSYNIYNGGFVYVLQIQRRSIGSSSWSAYDTVNPNSHKTIVFDFSSYQYTFYFSYVDNYGRWNYFYSTFEQSSDTVVFNVGTSAPDGNTARAQCIYVFDPPATPTPTPTPTPVPTPTPTPIPEDFDDITFWEDMGTKATGIWSLITQFFNGIFSNTILRNIVVYIPLFSLILAFVIFLIKLGG